MDAEKQSRSEIKARQGGSLARHIHIPAAAFVTMGTSCSLTSIITPRITIAITLLGCARQITIGTTGA
jgi:hypothetical protein